MRRCVLFGGLAVLITGCGKHNAAPVHPCGTVEGISAVDVNGVQVFPPDTTDWRTADDWCDEVEGLFPTIPGLVWTDELDSSAIMGFPNPCQELFFLHLDNDTTTYVDVRIVNDQFQPLIATDSIGAPMILFDVDSLGLDTGDLFRVYYRIVNADGTAHRGHGDMRYIP